MSVARRLADMAADVLAFCLRLGGRRFYRYFVDALVARHPAFESPSQGVTVRLHAPDPVAPDPAEREWVERIFSAYRAAKDAEREVDPLFHPAGGWKRMSDRAFAPLAEGIARNDLHGFHDFLANFGSSRNAIGIEKSHLIREAALDPRKRRHFERRIIAPKIEWWLAAGGGGQTLSALDLPRFGNLSGFWVEDVFITPGSIFSETYGCTLAHLLDRERSPLGDPPTIGELGGGFGRLIYYVSRNLKSFRYLDFDLPETLACASYFLMKAFPDKRFLLYGEGELNQERMRDFDFILLPSFEITKVPTRSVDLFVNENSLGVTPPGTCRFFVAEMCRAANALWHRNHEAWRNDFEDGSTSLINCEYPIPPDFEQVVRYFDPSGLMSMGRIDYDSDMFCYYYRRSEDR